MSYWMYITAAQVRRAIEVKVEDNADHCDDLIAENAFCAFHLMWEFEMMLPRT